MSRITRCVLTLSLALGAAAAVPAVARPGVPAVNDVTSVMPVIWQNEVWTARESPVTRQNPNHNFWIGTPQTVFTDADGRLHMVAKKCGLNWCGVGVGTLKNDYGYGTYRFVIDTPMGELDPLAVIGMFTYNKEVRPSRQESDVELSPWGQDDPKARNAQWVVQPWKRPGHLVPFTVPRNSPMTYEFTWGPKSVVFRARVGTSPNARVYHSWRSTKALPGAPQPGTEVHLNLWFEHGDAPYDKSAQEVVFRSFTYTPRG
ncbi:MAG: hypothetical protein QOJ03_2032 [Frankiaceae bacterium]|nr:hypothetical protein [Frankiaceae bacterium]